MGEQADVLIVGAGPTGLAAGLFLVERGISCRIIDKAGTPTMVSRAQLLNPRTLELLNSVGVAADLVKEARPIHGVSFYQGWDRVAELEFGDAHPQFHMSVLPQMRTEALLTEALAQKGIVPERRLELEKFMQDETGVDCMLVHPGRQRESTARNCYLVRTERTAKYARVWTSPSSVRTFPKSGRYTISTCTIVRSIPR